MPTLDMLEAEFIKQNFISGNIPTIVKDIANSMCSTNIPYRMKLAIAFSELTLFISQFRINILHWNGSIIPINSITFCIAKSGASKDSSVHACRKCFASGYKLLEDYRNQCAVDRAINKATEAGRDLPERYVGYKDFYESPSPLFMSIPTSEGLIQHISDLQRDKVGSAFVYSGEISQDLVNINFPETCKTISELYDLGNKDAKIIKNKENQNKSVSSFPVSALFVGSPSYIIYDDAIKKKFKTEFTSKLARRSYFIFANEDLHIDDDLNLEESLNLDRERENRSIEYRNKVDEYMRVVTENLLQVERGTVIEVSDRVRDLFNFYKRYNESQAEIISEMFPVTQLTRQHLQWKAFKLSGALALIDLKDVIQPEHYKAAVEYCELIADDIHNFEIELLKEPYELFVKYVHEYAINGFYEMSLHQLRKARFVNSKMLSVTGLKELIKLANSYDKLGTYSFNDKTNSIVFNQLENSSLILLSYLKVPENKEAKKKRCASGYTCEEIKFAQLEEMLQGDYAYTCFKFMNGIRGKDNIISGCKWIILDIDDTEMSDNEAHILIEDLNHFIVRTSNKNNPYKYRVLIEIDNEVNIPDIHWVTFIQKIALDYGFKADKCPKSQIFFSYSDREILKNTEGKPLEIKPYLDFITNISLDSKVTYFEDILKNLTETEKKQMLDDPLTTFERAYNARDGEGRRKLIWAAKYARELGASKEYVKNLITHISQNYWTKPLDQKSHESMLRQIERWQGFKE